jgi:hypothetical protein
MMEVGESEIVYAAGVAVIGSEAVACVTELAAPPEAVIVAVVFAVTAVVETVNVAVLLPDATVTLAGTVADAELLDRLTEMAEDALALRVMVPVDVLLPYTEVGLSVTLATAAPGVTV